MNHLIRLTFALAVGGVALPALATAGAPSAEGAAAHEAAISAIRAGLASAAVAHRVQRPHAKAAAAKAMGSDTYPGSPAPNPARAYPPSCAAWPLPDAASGTSWTARVPLYTRNAAGQEVTSEPVTITIWRIACSSSGNRTPYNTDGGYNSMTLMRIDRDAANEGHTDVYPTFPVLQVSQGGVSYSDAASIARAATEPNTVVADGPFDAPIFYSTTYVLENYNVGGDYTHVYDQAFQLMVSPYASDANPVEFTIPAYDPAQNTYPDAFTDLPIDGYMAASWYDPSHGGEGMLVNVLDNPDGSRTFFGAWFTYDPLGLPFWITVQGVFPVGAVAVDATGYYQTGGGFAGDFGSTTDQHVWGTLHFAFPNCATMVFSYNGQTDTQTNGPGGSGTRTWTRIADNNGMNCE